MSLLVDRLKTLAGNGCAWSLSGHIHGNEIGGAGKGSVLAVALDLGYDRRGRGRLI